MEMNPKLGLKAGEHENECQTGVVMPFLYTPSNRFMAKPPSLTVKLHTPWRKKHWLWGECGEARQQTVRHSIYADHGLYFYAVIPLSRYSVIPPVRPMLIPL